MRFPTGNRNLAGGGPVELTMSVYDFSVRAADGGTLGLDAYKGNVLLLVNVASKCGFTPQYEGLEALYQDTKDRGVQVLGFPCNQFGDQEPGTDADIQQFCSTTYNVTFPVLSKVDVNGPDADPLYAYLRTEAPGDFGPDNGFLFQHVQKTRPEAIGTDEVKWNFTKFLVGRDGNVIRRYESTATPEDIRSDLDALLTA
jgi:glutathione peroxidase